MVVRKELELLQKSRELLDPKVGQNTAIDIEDGGFRLARDLFHFLEVGGIGSDLTTFVFQTNFVEFRFGVVAPRATLFDVEDGGHDA